MGALVRQSLGLQIFIFNFNFNSVHKKEAIRNTDKNFSLRVSAYSATGKENWKRAELNKQCPKDQQKTFIII